MGYYQTQLQNGVRVEISASRHAGIMQYSFPAGEKHILVDVSHVCIHSPCPSVTVIDQRKYLPGSPTDPNSQFYIGGEIQVEDDGKAYSGYGTYVGGWNNGTSSKLSHFLI